MCMWCVCVCVCVCGGGVLYGMCVCDCLCVRTSEARRVVAPHAVSRDATSSGAECTPKFRQYRMWSSGRARRNDVCACVQILTSNTYSWKQLETRQNRRYITIPAEYKSAHRCSRCAMVCVLIYSAKMQVVSAKKIMLHSPKRSK